MCVWFWKEELNWVELPRVKPHKEEPSDNERRPALEGASRLVRNVQVEQVLVQRMCTRCWGWVSGSCTEWKFFCLPLN